MTRKLKISEAAAVAGVSIQTLRQWEKKGTLVPERTRGGQRRYDITTLPGVASQRSDELLMHAVDFLVAVRAGNKEQANAIHARIKLALAVDAD